MTKRKRWRAGTASSGRMTRQQRNLDRIERALKRWQARVDDAPTATARLAAAYDMQRASAQLAAELVGIELAEIYIAAAADGLAANARDICAQIEEIL